VWMNTLAGWENGVLDVPRMVTLATEALEQKGAHPERCAGNEITEETRLQS
jgi:hypothetical protein